MRIWAAALAVTCAACIVPEDIRPVPERPPSIPPFVMRTWPEQGVLRVPRECGSIQFHLFDVSDCDLEDTVSVRWFVNYWDGIQRAPLRQEFRGGPAVASCARGQDSFRLSIPDVLLQAPSEPGVDTSVLHVEAVLSDGFAEGDALNPHRKTLPGRSITRVSWTVELFSAGECPR